MQTDDLNSLSETSPTQQDTATTEVVYVGICSGLVIILPVNHQPGFVLGQVVVFIIAILCSLLALLAYYL